MQISDGLCQSTHAGYHGAEYGDNANTAAAEGDMTAVWSCGISQTAHTQVEPKLISYVACMC